MQHLGKYQLIRRLGSGGMAEVFLARTTVAQGLSKELVIKKIHPAYAGFREFVSMFVTEAKIALGLNHPNIVQVFDFGAVDEAFFLAMEYVAGIDLLHLVREVASRKRFIPIPLCAHIVKEVAKGLDYAHRKTDDAGEPLSIVHRDVSPHNVLLSWDGAVKLVDFGIARARGIDEHTSGLKGKYSYMSPEQARGEEVDRRSDVFSAGVVLFELCCGRPLFPGRGTRVLDRVKTGAFPRPRDVNPQIPPELEKTILEALSFHRDDRFATARDLQIALDEFLFSQAQRATDIAGPESLADFLLDIVPRARGESQGDQAEPLAHGTPVSEITGVLGDDADTVLLDEFDSVSGDPGHRSSPVVARERKHVVVVEAQMRGRTALIAALGEDRTEKIAGTFFSALRDIAFKHHVHVHELGQDGATLLVGLPLASEDDASRAIRTCLALLDALRGIVGDSEPALHLSLGVQRGVVEIARDAGGNREPVLAAAERTLARRLAERASPGKIVLGSQVYRMAKRNWYCEELPEVTILGDAAKSRSSNASDGTGAAASPTSGSPDSPRSMWPDSEHNSGAGDSFHARAYRLIKAKKRADRLREDAARAGELVGRDLELKALRDAYRHALTTRGKRAVLIHGEAGIGKRTLVHSFLSEIGDDRALVIRATPQVNRAYTPYAVLADLARDLLGLTDESDADELADAVTRTLPMLYDEQLSPEMIRRDVAAVARLFGTVLSGYTPVSLDATELRERMSQLVLRIELGQEPEKPLIFVCEDLHWADDESLDLFLEHFARPGSRPLLGVLTTRPDPRVMRFASDFGATTLRLGSLDLDDTTELIAQRLARRERATRKPEVDDLARQVFGAAGGNPFFICELLDSLIERGMLVAEHTHPGDLSSDSLDPGELIQEAASQAVGAEISAVRPRGPLRWLARDPLASVPSSVEALLATRIDRLPEGQKEALLRAAVLGRAFRVEGVSALLDRPADDELAALHERGFLHKQDSGYAFHNELGMTVAYELLPRAERPRWHRRAATYLAKAPTYRSGSDDGAIALHLEKAGDRRGAATRYLAAASHAVAIGGNSDASRHLTRALDLLPVSDHEGRFRAHGQRQEVFRRLARGDEQLQAIAEMRRSAESLGDAAKIATADMHLADYHIDHGDTRAASRAIDDALAHARRADDALVEAHSLQLAAHIAHLTEGSAEAVELCDRAVTLCNDSSEGRRRMAAVLQTRGRASAGMGRMEDAIASLAESLSRYRELGLKRNEAGVLDDMGSVCSRVGELEEALRYHQNAMEIDRTLGDRAGLAGKLGSIGQAYAEIGDTDRAEQHLHRAIRLAEQIGDPATTAEAVITLGKVQWLRNEHRRAQVVLRHGLDLARQSKIRFQEARAMVYLAMAGLESGTDVEEALAMARQATTLASAIPAPTGQIFGLTSEGLALAHLGRFDDAADASARAVAEQTRQSRPENAELVLYFHAMLCEAAGRRADAVRAISRARREVERKAGCIQDRALHASYVSSKIPRAVIAYHERIAEKSPP